MAQTQKQEPVFDLIRNMTKAEKRNFKLYATRLAGNHEAKFLLLFDQLEASEEYDEGRILARCPIKKEQLPNMKAHLYRQILTSIRLLNVQHCEVMQLREQLDFAQILYDKGLYRQSLKILEKIKDHAYALEDYGIALEILNFLEKIDTATVDRDMTGTSDRAYHTVSELCRSVEAVGELSNTAVRVYSLYNKLGYARSQKDIDLIVQYFGPRLEAYAGRTGKMNFHEKFNYYRASAWYWYIQHNFVMSYRFSRRWVDLFHAHPRMKGVMYDDYIRGCAQILEGLYLMRKHRQFTQWLDVFEREFPRLAALNNNAAYLAQRTLVLNRINKCFTEGTFAEGLGMVPGIEQFIARSRRIMSVHYRMLLYYKIACLYFGDGQYRKCMEYLSRITTTKDPQIRRDLQCFARILNLIASYEAGIDYNLDYQIRSVYSFLVKMNDMNAVQKEMLAFLKKLNSIYADEIKEELKALYERLKPYGSHPYERRAFYYLDILSWLESLQTGRPVAEIIRRKFLRDFS
ncbi:MAG: hypothetical protein LUE10_02855 [Alistipes sp.]|nr:hypothetical protein [Alistipes sp.]